MDQLPVQQRTITAPMAGISARPYLYLKRLLDVVGSLLLLVLFLPLFLIIALAILLESRGPVFFLQPRLGRRGKVFGLYKFRTIQRSPTEKDLAGSQQSISGQDGDITKVGRVLRHTGLNELPQLINILRGEMSFIGPRPAVLCHEQYYTDWHRHRLEITPGVTGLAQVCGRNAIPWGWRVALDRHYVENVNLGLDLAILFKTAYVVFGAVGTEGAQENYFDFTPPSRDIVQGLASQGVYRFWLNGEH
jgi:lipopolysaccharide/colanic/teichoic acid biosynthesis glycosyltransferase